MAKTSDAPAQAEVCPVDSKTREAWLKTNPAASFPGAAVEADKSSKGNSCDSSTIDQSPPPPPPGLFSRLFSSSASQEAPVAAQGLGTERIISTIPRASPVDEAEGAKPANSEKESGVSESGNWIYPSEKMFFEAMKRKGHSGEAADMKTIVPIHNAVNERAWQEIKEWEKPYGADK
jgi:cytochrome c heme-lyase